MWEAIFKQLTEKLDKVLELLFKAGGAIEHGPLGFGRALARVAGKPMAQSQSFDVTLVGFLIVLVIVMSIVSLVAGQSPLIKEWGTVVLVVGSLSMILGFIFRK